MLSSAPIRTAVLIGAGGSSFAHLPTVMSFFERIDWPPSNGFHAACEELARRISILEGTQECLAWPKFDAEKLFAWLEILERTMHLQDPHMGILIPNPKIPIPVAGVIAHIRQQIVKIYGSRIDPEFLSTAPHRTLVEALDKLHPPRAPLYVFTTNYDPVLEQVFKEWSARPLPSGRKLRACDGFSSDHPRRWQPQLFSVGPEDGERLIHLVKLHGSATWKLDTTGPIETGWGMPTPHDCLLYFGYKSVPETEPFITLHTLLKTALVQSDAIIAIGFRFADPYTRELFDFALRANPQLRLVCCLTRFPEPASPLSLMMNRFPGRVLMLADTTGNCIPFGHADFAMLVEQTLADTRQADAVA